MYMAHTHILTHILTLTCSWHTHVLSRAKDLSTIESIETVETVETVGSRKALTEVLRQR
jgi:hypothetical protein